MNSNRKIDELIINTFLSSGAMHIEESFAFAALSKYLNELELLRTGVPYTELGFSQRRAETAARILNSNDTLVANPDAFSDSRNTPEGSIAYIPLKGMMQMDGGPSSYGIADTIEFLNAAKENTNIVGAIMEVSTGGGEARAGNELKYAVQEFVQSKPLVAWADTMASAGIMAMLPANEIIAKHDRSRFGSIGTYMSIDKSFLEWYKANIVDIHADKSTNKNLEFRQMLEGDFSGIQKMVNKTNENFLADVEAFRPLAGDIEHTLSGAMFDTVEAKKRGLVDGMGNRAYAIKRIQYHQKNSY